MKMVSSTSISYRVAGYTARLASRCLNSERLNSECLSKNGCWLDIEAVCEQKTNSPNWRLKLVALSGNCLAACSLWSNPGVVYKGESVVALGNLSACCYETAMALLVEATAFARKEGHIYLIGPLDGSTWFKHRLPVWTDGSPLFMLEDKPQPHLQLAFEEGGFETIARYYSSRGPLPASGGCRESSTNQKISFIQAGLIGKNITLRSLCLHKFEEELWQIYKLCCESFANNFLFTPISFNDFFTLYKAGQNLINPELILLAEHQGQLAGILFALPDLNNSGQVIIKTLARHPDPYFAGLGGKLVEIFEAKAARLGYLSCVHAFMYADNVSLQISHNRTAAICREYRLWGMSL